MKRLRGDLIAVLDRIDNLVEGMPAAKRKADKTEQHFVYEGLRAQLRSAYEDREIASGAYQKALQKELQQRKVQQNDN